ncbi:hypothetical protein J437_LFUL003335 [Ladona fulva]|uniref:PiggyBac transposable element-derived protein domain-containing protein n=1 Tax=Ladona fulva TaxID=123851 RepID=A0A8K0NZ24_LADFU|nr:hypothetical protein J437_LFUL003335 [Ladona fulva]
MYIKSKPDKYGLKIVTLNDAETSYLIHGIPYLGKMTLEDKTESIPEYFFREVTSSIHNTNRTDTADNWFISIPLLERMKNEPFNIPVTGIIQKNKRETPAEMKVSEQNPPHTKFVFSDITLLLHTPKKNKLVLLASTYSSSTNIENGKPEIIHHYNSTKGGTDCFDMLCHAFTISRKTNCWLMQVFYGMLEQAKLSSLHTLSAGVPQGSTLSPILFNLFVNDLPSDPFIQRFLYADDLTIASQSSSSTLAIDRINSFNIKWIQMVHFNQKQWVRGRKNAGANAKFINQANRFILLRDNLHFRYRAITETEFFQRHLHMVSDKNACEYYIKAPHKGLGTSTESASMWGDVGWDRTL